MIIGPDANALMIGGAKYTIDRSLRFDGGAYLDRTPGVAGNRKTWTFSAWMKRTTLGTYQYPLYVQQDGNNFFYLYFDDADHLCIYAYIGSLQIAKYSTAVFRDPAAWYHVVVAMDTTQATASNRTRIYVNGSEITSFSTDTNTAQNADHYVNSTTNHRLGLRPSYGYTGDMADVYLIDGQQLTPGSFAETDSLTGQWVPKAYGGTRGTCGCHLDFSDNSSTTALGYDKTRTNDWSTTGFSVTAGSGNDSLSDTPTNNYCALNPLANGGLTISNGALDVSVGASWLTVLGTFGMETGKWYWEFLTNNQYYQLGIRGTKGGLAELAADTYGWSYYSNNGNKYNSNVATSYGSAYNGGGYTISVLFDADARELILWNNGTSQGVAFTGLAVDTYFPAFCMYNSSGSVNFGQRPFTYTPPAGYKTLCANNLPAPTIKKPATQMNVKLYTGTNAAQNLTGVGFQPDFIWFKNRSAANAHALYDSVRGHTHGLSSDNSGDELTASADKDLVSFDADGFSVGTIEQLASPNYNGSNLCAWCWKKGATPGFDIVTYTGTGSNLDVNHSLGVVPAFISIKGRDGTPPQNWWTWHKSLAAYDSAVFLDLTNAVVNGQWNNIRAASTSTQFFLGTDTQVNRIGWKYVAYLWSEVPGFSKFGSYIGNGSADGPFVWCGFRPKFVMIKNANSTYDWYVLDTVRNSYNVCNLFLDPNLSGGETTSTFLDSVSNGFKIRDSYAGFNGSGNTIIFAAFAEAPFKYANGR